MDYKRMGLGLGYFSIALGVAELIAPGRISRMLGRDDRTTRKVLRLFGARELLAGGMLLRGPAVSTNVWNRVVGDVIDLTALAVAVPGSRRRAAIAGAAAFVGGALAADIVTARGLDRETGRTFPRSERNGETA